MWFDSWFNPQFNAKPAPIVQETVMPDDTGADCYTVGVLTDNRTVVKITSGYTTLSLEMNNAAVRQMIRLLEAAIREENDQPESQPDEPVV